jgi:hypothetical protein
VKAPHPIIRPADDDRRVRKVVAAVESAPMVPYAREREGTAIGRREIVRRLRPFRASPLIETRSRKFAETLGDDSRVVCFLRRRAFTASAAPAAPPVETAFVCPP